tara:strand:- start:135 stop:590 length:456 start_codon:yes stop_codon:yes gene_type:complete
MKLLLENWRDHLSEISLGADMAKSIEYTGLVLNDLGHRALLPYVPEGWTPKSHHMTIISPPEMKRRLPSRWLGTGLCVKVVGIAQNDRVASALVDLEGVPLPMRGPSLPHITIAINPLVEAKAEESNNFQMSDYDPIELITVCGTIQEIQK